MVEVHYRSEPMVNPDTGVVEPFHTRAMYASVEDAIAQCATDIAELGLDPIGVFEHDPDKSAELWDGTPAGKTYDPKDWRAVMNRAELHRRAKAHWREATA